MGGKSAPAPDYTELAAVSREAVAAGKELGTRQLDFSERQYDELKPLFESIAALQMEAQRDQIDQAQDYYQYMQETFRPVERGIVEDALAFSTESYRERMAGEAAAAAGRAFTNLQRSASRADAARGLNPNSPAARALRQQANVEMAASRSQQMTGARDRAEQLGYARQLDAAGLGRGLPGASAGAYAGSVGAGTAAVGTSMAAGNQYMAGLGAGAGTMMSGYQTGMQGYGNILNSQTSIYNNAMNAQGEFLGSVMGLGGTLGGAAIGKYSDRRLKEDIKFLYEDMNSGLNVYEFSYTGQPNRRFIGVMADEVEEVFPEAVNYDDDGYASVDYAAIGMRMIEVSEEVA
jgi:hypothetical protein